MPKRKEQSEQIIVPLKPITVKCIRHSDDGTVWGGCFTSKVYAISGNRFLVYDNGVNSLYDIDEHGCTDEGFCWVDFTERIKDLTRPANRESGEKPIIPPITLVDE